MEPDRIPNNLTARDFTPDLTRGEAIAGWIYLPIHIFLLPVLLGMFQNLYPGGPISDAAANLIYYGISLLVVMVCFLRLLRREFDHGCDYWWLRVLDALFMGYLLLWVADALLSVVLILIGTDAGTPNDTAVAEIFVDHAGWRAAVAVIAAPLVEETLFRGVAFQSIRKKSRIWAYVVSITLFCVYHVWQYAVVQQDLWVLLYALEYVPVSYVLTWVYERSGCLWTSIAFHAGYNLLSIMALRMLQ